MQSSNNLSPQEVFLLINQYGGSLSYNKHIEDNVLQSISQWDSYSWNELVNIIPKDVFFNISHSLILIDKKKWIGFYTKKILKNHILSIIHYVEKNKLTERTIDYEMACHQILDLTKGWFENAQQIDELREFIFETLTYMGILNNTHLDHLAITFCKTVQFFTEGSDGKIEIIEVLEFYKTEKIKAEKKFLMPEKFNKNNDTKTL